MTQEIVPGARASWMSIFFFGIFFSMILLEKYHDEPTWVGMGKAWWGHGQTCAEQRLIAALLPLLILSLLSPGVISSLLWEGAWAQLHITRRALTERKNQKNK